MSGGEDVPAELMLFIVVATIHFGDGTIKIKKKKRRINHMFFQETKENRIIGQLYPYLTQKVLICVRYEHLFRFIILHGYR